MYLLLEVNSLFLKDFEVRVIKHVGDTGAMCDNLSFSAYRPAANKAMYSMYSFFGLNIA